MSEETATNADLLGFSAIALSAMRILDHPGLESKETLLAGWLSGVLGAPCTVSALDEFVIVGRGENSPSIIVADGDIEPEGGPDPALDAIMEDDAVDVPEEILQFARRAYALVLISQGWVLEARDD